MISVEHISKSFSGQLVLDSVSLSMNAGSSYALVGPNGSGKTTLIKCILGLVRPTSGDITFEGLSVLDRVDHHARIGYMPQIGRYPENLKVGQLMAMMENLRSLTSGRDEELLHAFRLHEFYHKPMYSLSGGMRQKVGAALAFLFDPPVLILDEPSAGLDPFAAEILKEKIQQSRNRGKLILITSHNLAELDELTDRLICLVDGVVRYDDTIQGLKELTGQDRFSAALARLMNKTTVTNTPK